MTDLQQITDTETNRNPTMTPEQKKQTARQFKTKVEANTAIISLGLQSAVAEYDELLEVWSVLLESGLLLTISSSQERESLLAEQAEIFIENCLDGDDQILLAEKGHVVVDALDGPILVSQQSDGSFRVSHARSWVAR